MRALAAPLFALLVACAPAGDRPASDTPPTATETVSAPLVFEVPAGAAAVAGGCGTTTVYQGAIAKSLEAATGYNPPTGVPYAIARPAIAAGFIFGYPLHTPGAGIAYANKILWVVGTPRSGDLMVEGHPLGRAAPTVRYSFPANSGPGDIYPSGVDVPEPGCWLFALAWSGRTALIELEYR